MASDNHMQDDRQYQNELGILTRRTFLRGAAGALATTVVTALMPVAEGTGEPPVGDFLTVRQAWAASSSATFSFKVVSKHEVGIHVGDVANLGSDDKPVPVPGATVELRSLYPKAKKKMVSGQTDDKGNVIFDIADLSVYDDDGKPLDGIYQFNGSLVVKSPTSRKHLMREFSTGLIRVEGASGIEVGTHALDDMSIYPERITFDRWDIHYSENTFYRSTINKRSHTFLIRLYGASKEVTIKLKDKGGKAWHGLERTAKARYDEDSGLYAATFEGEFLNKNNKDDCLPEGTTTLRFSYTYDGIDYWSDIEFEAVDAPIDSAASTATLMPMFPNPDMGLSCNIPVGVAGLDGVNISCWTPRLPFQVSFSPTSVMLGFGVDAINGGKRLETMTDTGDKDPNGWMESSGRFFTEKYKKVFKDAFDKISTLIYGKGFREGNLVNKSKFTSKITWSFRAEAVLGLSWTGENEYAENVFTGSLTLGAQVALMFTYTAETLLGGWLPVYVTFSLNMQGSAAIMLVGTVTQAKDSKELALTNTVWDLGNYDPISVTFRLAFTVTLGVGVKDVISAGVSGTLAFTMFMGFLNPNLLATNNPDPHTVITCEVKIEVFVQLVVLKASATLWSMKGTLEDNWKEASMANDGMDAGEQLWEGDEARFMLTQKDGTKRHTISRSLYSAPLTNADIYQELAVVKNDELGYSVESAATLKDASVFAAANDAARGERLTLHRDKVVQLVALDDGTIETRLVDCPGAVAFTYDDDELEAASVTEEDELEAASVTEEGELEGSEAAAAAEGETAPVEVVADEDQAAATDDVVLAVAAAAEASGEDAGADGEEDLLGDPIFGFGVSAPDEYEYTDVSSATGALCFAAPLRTQIASHGGIVPTLDAAIFQNAFSDPRQRVVVIGGVPYLFRIITVEYAGAQTKRRTRLAASAFNESTGTWGAPQVISYGNDDPDLPRIDIFDYDFDVVTRPEGEELWFKETSAAIVVTGGLRPAGDDSGVYEVFTSPTVTFLLVDANLNVKFSTVRRATAYLGEDKKHMVISPHLLDRCGVESSSGVFMLSFIHRSAVSADDIMSADPDVCKVTLTVALITAVGKKFSFVYRTLAEEVKLDPTVSGMEAALTTAANKDKYDLAVAMLFRYDHGYDVFTGLLPAGETLQSFELRRNVHSTEELPGLVMWPGAGHGPFLYTRKSTIDDPHPHLYEGTYSLEALDAARLTERIVDLEGFNGGAFGLSPKGTYLYFIDSRRGNGGDEIDINDTEKTTTTPVRDDVYRIKASKYIDGAFCEDFEFCELTHPIDSLLPITFTSKQSTFISSEITDADRSQATLSYLVVPHAVVAEIEGFTPIDYFVCAGSPCEFELSVRNHGNVVISGFDVDLIDPDDNNNVVSSAHVGQIDPSKVRLTPTSRNWVAAEEDNAANGRLTLPGGWAERVAGFRAASVEDDALAGNGELSPSLESGQLMPGKTIGYPVTFDIPDHWEGVKTVIVRVRDAWASEDLLMTTGVASPLTHFHGGTTGELTVHTAEVEKTMVDPSEGWSKRGADDPEQPDDPHDPTPPHDDHTDDPGTRRRAMPSTGDPLQALGPLSMLLGGMGAGLVAYGARRKMVEEEREQKSDRDLGKD